MCMSKIFPLVGTEFHELSFMDYLDIYKLKNMNIEARDRQNPSLCAPATISKLFFTVMELGVNFRQISAKLRNLTLI